MATLAFSKAYRHCSSELLQLILPSKESFFKKKNEWGASIKASGLNDEKGSCLLCPGHEWSHASTVPALMGHTAALCTTVPTLVNEIDTENLPQCKGS